MVVGTEQNLCCRVRSAESILCVRVLIWTIWVRRCQRVTCMDEFREFVCEEALCEFMFGGSLVGVTIYQKARRSKAAYPVLLKDVADLFKR
jgi:hypothetical protein